MIVFLAFVAGVVVLLASHNATLGVALMVYSFGYLIGWQRGVHATIRAAYATLEAKRKNETQIR